MPVYKSLPHHLPDQLNRFTLPPLPNPSFFYSTLLSPSYNSSCCSFSDRGVYPLTAWLCPQLWLSVLTLAWSVAPASGCGSWHCPCVSTQFVQALLISCFPFSGGSARVAVAPLNFQQNSWQPRAHSSSMWQHAAWADHFRCSQSSGGWSCISEVCAATLWPWGESLCKLQSGWLDYGPIIGPSQKTISLP